MSTVSVNKDGYVLGPYFNDFFKEFEVDNETAVKLSTFPLYRNWRYNFETKEYFLEELMSEDILKARRQKECFNIIDNRSQLWYNHLSDEHKIELDEWYQKWLDVTETKVIPTKPEWLK